MIGKYLIEEHTTRESLSKFYGAAYEIIIFKDGRFMKIGDTEFFHSDIDFQLTKYKCNLKLYMGYDYVDDVLRIKSFVKKDESYDCFNILVGPADKSTSYLSGDILKKITGTPYQLNKSYLYMHSICKFFGGPGLVDFRLSCATGINEKPIFFYVDKNGFHFRHSPLIISEMKKQCFNVIKAFLSTGKLKNIRYYSP